MNLESVDSLLFMDHEISLMTMQLVQESILQNDTMVDTSVNQTEETDSPQNETAEESPE